MGESFSMAQQIHHVQESQWISCVFSIEQGKKGILPLPWNQSSLNVFHIPDLQRDASIIGVQ